MKDSTYHNYFGEYQSSVFQVERDLRFWKHFLSVSINKYKDENPVNRWINQSGFSLYNISPETGDGWLRSSNKVLTIEIDDLPRHSDNFFNWVANLSIIRIYNATELLLLRSIRYRYFPEFDDPILGRKETNRLISAIKKYLDDYGCVVDTTNNRHIVSFLKMNSNEIKSFCVCRVNNVNWKTNWENFYELISILRNIITHHGMIISRNTNNQINSVAGDIFHHYFHEYSATSVESILKVKDEQYFLGFITHVNDFAGNMIKFIAEQKDLKFIGLY